jgi:hypothetical protein
MKAPFTMKIMKYMKNPIIFEGNLSRVLGEVLLHALHALHGESNEFSIFQPTVS